MTPYVDSRGGWSLSIYGMDKLSRLHTWTWSLATTLPISFLRLIEGEQQIHAKFADCIHGPNLLYTMRSFDNDGV
jgi:hypothetical protein